MTLPFFHETAIMRDRNEHEESSRGVAPTSAADSHAAAPLVRQHAYRCYLVTLDDAEPIDLQVCVPLHRDPRVPAREDAPPPLSVSCSAEGPTGTRLFDGSKASSVWHSSGLAVDKKYPATITCVVDAARHHR